MVFNRLDVICFMVVKFFMHLECTQTVLWGLQELDSTLTVIASGACRAQVTSWNCIT